MLQANIFNFSENLKHVRMCYTGKNKQNSKHNFPVTCMYGSLELFLQSPQCHPTSGHGRVRCAPWKTEQLSTGELCTGKAMETHFYTAIFFFLSLDFSYEHSENLHTIFFYAP